MVTTGFVSEFTCKDSKSTSHGSIFASTEYAKKRSSKHDVSSTFIKYVGRDLTPVVACTRTTLLIAFRGHVEGEGRGIREGIVSCSLNSLYTTLLKAMVQL